MEIYILGAGNQGLFVQDIVHSLANVIVAGFFDDRYPEIKNVNGVPVLGKISETDVRRNPKLALGIGDPKTRELLFKKKVAQGYQFPSIIHHNSVVSPNAKIGEGVTMGPYCTVMAGSSLGKAACLLSHVNINQGISVGAFTLMGAGVVVGNNAKIEEGCHIGMSAIVKPNVIVPPWTDYFQGE